MTPEGKVKDKIKKLLDKYGVYYFMPVQMGYGPAGLDFHCAVQARNICIAFFVEAKKLEGDTTERQDKLTKELRAKKAKVFVVDDDISLMDVERYLVRLHEASKR